MSSMWVKYTLSLTQAIEEEFCTALLDSPYTLGWTEPQIEVILTDNGYDYAEQADKPMLCYVFAPLSQSEETSVEQFREYLSKWKDQVRLLSFEMVEEENESWKEEFQPVWVGDWVIAPSWTKAEELEGAANLLWIDPGAAFGTGYHVTTQDIIRYLQTIELTNRRVLDLGAGSGILSLLCLRLGAKAPVYAVDINPEADWQIRQNLDLNNLPPESVEIVIGDPLEEDEAGVISLPPQVDLVMVNIGGDEDVAMLPVVKKALAPKGLAILSGIVTWNRDKVVKAYQDAGFELVDEKTSNEWVTLVTKLCENREKFTS